ncbi:unnamed protein product [Arctia plantaginis]|uniref:Follicular epithelium yolk protein subunit n=1 Tax=Arctia plantaginis TaxID=874455 RepID=A0A8S0ZJ70_ARCPL|nr:unnamed protein product [Arctia plantaginis]
MCYKFLLLILLPALAYGNVKIKIKGTKNITDASVQFSGKEKAIISEEERQAFQLDDESLKRASKIFSGKRCTDVFLKRPTPWVDVYRKFGWKEIKRTLKPVQARIIGINVKPVAIATAEYKNNQAAYTVKHKAAVKQTVEETVTHTWNISKELTIGKDFSYTIDFGKGNTGGKISLSHTSKWGNDTTKERKITIGTKSSVEVPPGDVVLATLVATQVTMEIEVEYEVTVAGHVFCNYQNGYRGHQWWAYPLWLLQKDGSLPTLVKSSERISIGFYTNMRIEFSDLETGAVVKTVDAQIIKVLDFDKN